MIHTYGRSIFPKLFLATFGALCLVLAVGPQGFTAAADTTARDPWNKSQTVMPEEFAKVIASTQGKKPLVVYVGFEFLYKTAHVPGAKFVGTGREAKGIEALNKWARGIAHDQEIVIYCGCCPLKDCPNIRPAFEALHQMGFAHLKVLYMEDNFAKDWVDKGYPTEKGAAK